MLVGGGYEMVALSASVCMGFHVVLSHIRASNSDCTALGLAGALVRV